MTVKSDIQQLATWLREFEGDEYPGQASEVEEAKVNLTATMEQHALGRVSDQSVLAAAEWVAEAQEAIANHPLTLINSLDDQVNLLDSAAAMQELLKQFVAAFDWGSDEPISGADLVDFAAEWVEQVTIVLKRAEA